MRFAPLCRSSASGALAQWLMLTSSSDFKHYVLIAGSAGGRAVVSIINSFTRLISRAVFVLFHVFSSFFRCFCARVRYRFLSWARTCGALFFCAGGDSGLSLMWLGGLCRAAGALCRDILTQFSLIFISRAAGWTVLWTPKSWASGTYGASGHVGVRRAGGRRCRQSRDF